MEWSILLTLRRRGNKRIIGPLKDSMTMTMIFDRIEDARSLAQIVVETVREPLLVLDHTLKIQVASSSFHKSFQIGAEDTPGQYLFALDNGAWDIPALHILLERSLVNQTVVEGFLVAR